ncbi:ABC transporter substrate-binding protein [Streptomyces longispororuber]|uniref:ABC transporter substrate-binding protein n=1 Tax=Streptomyces longispororuber TaxID=68230 RepID=UPI0033CD7444
MPTDTSSTQLRVGVVAPLTGRLAPLGAPLSYVLRALAPRLGRVRNGARSYAVRVAVRDGRSDPQAARRAVRDLAEGERAHLVLTMAGTQVLPAVTAACEELGVPCVSTTFPWQAYLHTRGASARDRFRWTYHFAWGLDDIAAVFADLWEQLGGPRTVGCLWNDGLQGQLLRDERHGFVPVASERGHTLVDPGGYREGTDPFDAHVAALRARGAELVTSAATATDLARFHRRAREGGPPPRLITCSRWLTYPHTHTTRAEDVHAELGDARVATLVYWSPDHPYRSGLDGTTCAELARGYQQATGSPWLQPLGLAHALVEVAHHALTTAADPTDRAALAQALAGARVATVAGTLDWTAGPSPAIARLPLVGGQWHPGPRGPRLAVVTNTGSPAVPLTGSLVPAW